MFLPASRNLDTHWKAATVVVLLVAVSLVPQANAWLGSWEMLVQNAGISSMHTAVTNYGNVVLLDHTNIGPSNISLAGITILTCQSSCKNLDMYSIADNVTCQCPHWAVWLSRIMSSVVHTSVSIRTFIGKSWSKPCDRPVIIQCPSLIVVAESWRRFEASELLWLGINFSEDWLTSLFPITCRWVLSKCTLRKSS